MFIPTLGAAAGDGIAQFRRIATFPVFENTNVDEETVAEIVAASEDGMTLIYTDAVTGNVGFVDITDPANPQPGGVIPVGGEPTSVAVAGPYALAAVDTSPDFVNPSGLLHIIHIDAGSIVRTIDLGGQPDSVAVSPDRRYAGVIIENQRDEDLGNGEPPQLPGGFFVIVDLKGDVADWSTRSVELAGIPDLFPTDPEPEYVDINAHNIAVLTLQENNHIVLVDMADGSIVKDFPAGEVDLTQVDTNENDLIEPFDDLNSIPREADAVQWISPVSFATADEGDLFGGSRGFTIYDASGAVMFDSGNELEHLAIRHGHYPEDRSENKGNEPEGLEFAAFGADRLLFVGSERSNVVFVHRIANLTATQIEFVQVLPAGAGPEGLLAIPQRNLFVVSSEVDSRGDKIRASVSIYQRQDPRSGNGPTYPTVISADRNDGTPIPWAALSGLATEPGGDAVYAIYDSFYRKSRIFTMDTSSHPTVVTGEIVINDATGVLAESLADLEAALPDPGDFDPENMINDDGTINVDPEGVAAVSDGSFWIASEGAGNLVDGVSNPDSQPFTTPNLLLHVGPGGEIEGVVQLPLDLILDQLRFGFEGVAMVEDKGSESNGMIFVAFQRAWQAAGDPADHVRIGRYDAATGEWAFAYYPLDTPTSPNGGWVGLSELTYVGEDTFLVIERDDQAGPDARIKRIYSFSIADIEFMGHGETPNFGVVEKTLIRDIFFEQDFAPTGGYVLEKLEGLAVLPGGVVIVVNDNDGVSDSNGETQLMNLGNLLD